MTSPIRTVRLPQELLHSITGSLVDAITIYAKKAGVTVSIATGAGPIAVAATGDAVAITGVIVGVSTLTNLQTAIAASAAVDALLGVSGVGATIFGAAYAGLSVTRLFADFSVDVHGIAGRTVGGKYVPLLLNDNGELPVAVTIGDTIVTNPYLPATPGAASTKQQGTSGRLPVDVTLTINTGMSIIVHPKQGGVSVIGANGAAAAVSATGKVVTLTAKNDGTTTVTAMLALIAASASVAALLGISGTGADTFVATFTVAETPLWASGTIPANALMTLGPDGYQWPAEVDSTGGLKTSFSSLLFSEDGSRNVMRVERQGAETGRLVASGVVVAAGTGGRILGHVLEAGAGGATFNVRKDGVIGGAIIAQFVLAASTYRMEDWPDWPYGNGLYCEIVAGGGAFNFVVRNT